MGIESFGERHAPHFGRYGLSTRHCTSHLPGGQSIYGTLGGICRWNNIANKVARNGGTWIDTEESAVDVTTKGTGTRGCRARHDGEVLAGTEDDLFFSVMTELAVTFAVKSTKMGEGSSGGGRLSEKRKRITVSAVVTCQGSKIADVIPGLHTLATKARKRRVTFIFLGSSGL